MPRARRAAVADSRDSSAALASRRHERPLSPDAFAPAARPLVTIELDGRTVEALPGETLLRKAVAPPGEARADWEILCEVAKRLGFPGFYFASPAEITEEIASLTPTYGGIRHERLGSDGIQ